MEEGKVLKWHKKVGDPVAIGDVVAEVETDKANMELEAFDEGVLAEVRLAEGESAPVGAVIAVLTEPGGERAAAQAAKPAAKPPPAPSRPAAAPDDREARRPALVRKAPAEKPAEKPPPREPAAPRDAERVKASPLARKVARERDVDLARIEGTGPGGRIVEKDVEAALTRSEPAPRRPAPAERAVGVGKRVELSRIRRTTAKRMGESKREVPHFYAASEMRMDEAVRLKDQLAALGGDFDGITFTHVLLKAVGLALTRVPELNGSYDGDALVLHDAVNVGLATAVDDGLVVPVVRSCDSAPLATIVREARALVARARSGRFAADDLTGGTFTVSNLGMYPVSEFAAVINPPQAAILAVGTIREAAVVESGRLVPGRLMTVMLSCDHRIIDGVLAGRFLGELKALLEHPVALVL
jgi:pyruvate dehydrogenase E2 component (dihydrolipoamide acetyltransferase)